MTNKLRAMADRYNENKKREHAEAVKQYVENQIVPKLKKHAAAGYYGYTIDHYGSFKPAEVLACLENMGLKIVSIKNGYRVTW